MGGINGRFRALCALTAALLLAGCGAGTAPAQSGGSAPVSPGAASSAAQSMPAGSAETADFSWDTQMYQKTFLYDAGGQYFDLSISLPHTASETPAGEQINAFYAQRLTELRESYTDYADEIRRDLPAEIAAQCSVRIDGGPVYENGRLVTFSTYEEGYGGGAHGWHTYAYQTFDLTDGTRLSLADLFADGAAGVAAVRQEVLRQIAAAPMEEADEETRESLRQERMDLAGKLYDEPLFLQENFALTEEGVLIFFNEYDIASYAEGPAEYTVPYGLLGSLLRTEFAEKLSA